MEEMFEYADKDKDGKLSFQEFQVMLLKRRYITDKYVGLAGASWHPIPQDFSSLLFKAYI